MAIQPSENPKYKLYYFNLKALAEPIRLLLAYGGIEYEDVRVPREDWPEIKPTMPLGHMPVLEVDGQRVSIRKAITRYIANRVKLAGKNDSENLLIDMIVDTIHDIIIKGGAIHSEPDEAVKERKLAEFKKDTIPFYFEKLDSIAKENNGHLALGRLTWADLYFVGLSDGFKLMVNFSENYKNLERVIENVTSIPSVKEWFNKRPQTDY